jgi:hypothetical protein
MRQVKLSLTGVAPLLQHNPRLADPMDPITRQMKAITSKRKKTDEDLEALENLEFEGGLYMDPDPRIGPFIPATWVKSCLIRAGVITKDGQNIQRSVHPTDIVLPLGYRGPRDLAGLKGDPQFRDRQSVRVGMKRVFRVRPKFTEWTLDAVLVLDESVLNFDRFAEIASTAGQMIGLGDYRPLYGRFDAEVN